MNDQKDQMPGAFPGAGRPSFDEPPPADEPGDTGKHVHFQDENIDHEDPANFDPGLAPGAQTPQPPSSQSPVLPKDPPQAPTVQNSAQPVAHHQIPRGIPWSPPPSPPSQRLPLSPHHIPNHPMHHDHSRMHPPALPPSPFPPQHPFAPSPGYGGPPGMSPYSPPVSSRYGPQWQGPGPDPFGSPHGPPMPPPWAAGRVSHQQVRARMPLRPRPPLPPRQRVQYAPPEPIPIQIHEAPPRIQIQHIPAPQQQNNNNNNNNGGNSNGGGGMGDAMQMMMINQMMMQQMGAQQMQAAQFGAMINGGNGGGGGGRVEARADASCGGSGGANVQNCQNQALSGSAVSVNPPARRRRRVRKRQPKAKPRGSLKVHVGGPKGRLPIPPPPPRVNAPPPLRPVDGLGMDNWQEASIILCLAIVALIYLVASRNAAPEAKKAKPPSAARAMAT